jgi:hypothetical protein
MNPVKDEFVWPHTISQEEILEIALVIQQRPFIL